MVEIDTSDPIKLAIQAGVSVVVIVIVANAITAAGFTSGSTAVNATTAQPATVDADVVNIPSTVTVRATTENALAFDGNHTVTSSVPKNLTNGSWTVCSTVELAANANQQATYNILAYANESVLLQYDAGSWTVYYDNGTHDGAASITAPSPSNGLVPICGRYNATVNELTVVRGGAYSSPVELTSSTTARNVSWVWKGRQDEVRLFGTAVANTTLNEYAADPVRPQPSTKRLARLMFDEGSGDTSAVYFANAQANVSGLDWTNGVANPRKWLGMASAIEEGDDYELLDNPFAIRITEGSYLKGAPVEYVSWSDQSLVGLIAGFIPVLMGVLVLVVLADRIRSDL